MTDRKKLLSVLAIAIAATGIALAALVQLLPSGGGVRGDAPEDEPVAAGKMASAFTLKDLNGDSISLDGLRGKVVFLNVWATWCPPCREEMPSIEKLYDEFKNHKDFVILAVSQDSEGRGTVASFVKQHGYHFPILLDPENVVGEEYDVSGIPETFIIGRDGRIVAHHLGPFDWSRHDVEEALHELLSEKEGGRPGAEG